jgi:hypothetical protein
MHVLWLGYYKECGPQRVQPVQRQLKKILNKKEYIKSCRNKSNKSKTYTLHSEQNISVSPPGVSVPESRTQDLYRGADLTPTTLNLLIYRLVATLMYSVIFLLGTFGNIMFTYIVISSSSTGKPWTN